MRSEAFEAVLFFGSSTGQMVFARFGEGGGLGTEEKFGEVGRGVLAGGKPLVEMVSCWLARCLACRSISPNLHVAVERTSRTGGSLRDE